MKLSISNIAWQESADFQVYQLMRRYGFTGLEIAPTRIFPSEPYERIGSAKEWRDGLYDKFGFIIPSMQSIWYGRQEKIFGSSEERNILTAYTKKAVDLASAIGCKNLVFGCPRNRVFPDGADENTAISFFREIGDYAACKAAVIGMEANPAIYNTNYINSTAEAIELIKKVDSPGFRLNLDVGTMIYNEESVSELCGQVRYISHVHISEPGLAPIEKRSLHRELKRLLADEDYSGFVSVEMGRQDDPAVIEGAMEYVNEIFKE